MSYENNNHDELIIKYLPLVKKIVSKIEIRDSCFDQDDLVSVGVIGLMDAINKFDHSKNVPFEAYATLRIRGTVIDELRKSGRVSRDKIAKLNEYYLAKENLEKKFLRTPSEAEISQELGIDDKQLSKLHETVHYLSRISLDEVIFSKEGNDSSLSDVIKDDNITSPEDDFIKGEQKRILMEAISGLKDREKTILNLYYVEDLSLKEIAYILDISIPRVSQIHGKILIKLKDSIKIALKGDLCFIY